MKVRGGVGGGGGRQIAKGGGSGEVEGESQKVLLNSLMPTK